MIDYTQKPAKSSFIPALCIALALCASAQAQFQTQLGDVKDDRTTQTQCFGGLEITIKLFGGTLVDAKSIRTVVKTAVDDTGRDLIDHEKEKNKFEEVRDKGGDKTELTLKLKNPARKANTLKELSGEVEVFVPKNDPDSIVTVENFQNSGGTPIVSPALSAAGIEMTAYTTEQFKATKAKRAEEANKNAEANPEQGLARAVGKMLFNMGGRGPNAITVQIKDPHQKLVDIAFQDASGNDIKKNGWNSEGDVGNETKTYHFHSKLPDTTRLVIYVSTPKAIVTAPFSLKDVFLP